MDAGNGLVGLCGTAHNIPDRYATVENGTADGYDVFYHNAYPGTTSVSFPTWTSNNGQDDLKWPMGAKIDNSTWKYHINKSDHNNETGFYNTHVYGTVSSTNDEGCTVSQGYQMNNNILTMTANANNSKNDVNLNWNCSDGSQPYIYTLYRKLDSDSEYMPIQLTDNVRVLNIYPQYDNIKESVPTINFSDYDNVSKSISQINGLPLTAFLKYMMESPNAYSDGQGHYGYGLNKIHVDTADITSFNNNPDSYLKDLAGNYKYDVVMFGSSDANGFQDISTSVVTTMEQYVSQGHGILFGHDTIVVSDDNNAGNKANFVQLAQYCGLSAKILTNLNDSYAGQPDLNYNNNTTIHTGISNVQITKKGLLTNYPWNIGNLDDILTVPRSHTNGQIPNVDNDCWLKYYGDNNTTAFKQNNPTANFYLTSKNNVAMIQTGHSINSFNDSGFTNFDANPTTMSKFVSPDEQKLLANTLFYLAQTSEATSYEDKSAQDVAAPSNVSSVNYDDSAKTVSWSAPVDNGTTYDYYFKALGKKDNATKTSDTTQGIQKATVTTGVKGYYYTIDDNQNGTDAATYTTSTSIDVSSFSGGNHYLHIKTVDNAGNISDVATLPFAVPNKASITAIANNANNDVNLNWSCTNTQQPYIYTVYRKSDSDTKYMPIQLNDKVKVLNVYVNQVYGTFNTSINFSDYDNTTNSITQVNNLPISAALKYMMESPSAYNDGNGHYGYGLNKIHVDTADITSFNNNPDSYLKDLAGNYKYDVVVFGFTDDNGNQDISSSAVSSMEKFINGGHGILFGHDTVIYSWHPNFSELSQYCGITPTDHLGDTDDNYKGGAANFNSGTSEIQISKKGLLTDYPWNIGNINNILSVPVSHTSGQVPNSDNNIWMKYYGDTTTSTFKQSNPTSNFYLTSRENVAMIQTGHSINSYNCSGLTNFDATPSSMSKFVTVDEQKLLANTLFYLAQTSETTSYEDKSANDVAAPNNVSSVKLDLNSKKLNWSTPADNGTTYDYYLKALGKKDNVTTISSDTEGIKKATVTTGVKGYYYNIDTNASGTSASTFTVTAAVDTSNLSAGTYYIHVSTVDNAGNKSSVSTYKFVVPQINLTAAPQISGTDNYIKLNFNMNDDTQNYKYDVYRNGSLIGSIAPTNVLSQTYSDVNGKDAAAPDAVTGLSVSVPGKTGTVTYNPSADNGSSYSYYIVGTGADGSIVKSNTVTPTITKGLAGYSITADKTSGTVPDDIVDTTSAGYNVNLSVGTNYIHIKAIDNGGISSAAAQTAVVINPSNTTYIDGADVSTGTLDIYTYKTFKASVVTDGGYATSKFPFAVTDGTNSYAANTDIPLNLESSSGGNNTFSKIFKITSAVANGTVTSDSSKAYAVNNLSPETASNNFNLKVHSLVIDGLKVVNIVRAPQPTTLPQNCPLPSPIGIKTGYNVTLEADVEGQDIADLSFYSGGNPVKIYSASNLNSNTERISSTAQKLYFILYFDELPVNSVIDAKITAYDTAGGYSTVNNVLGIGVFKITGSYLDDSYINLIR